MARKQTFRLTQTDVNGFLNKLKAYNGDTAPSQKKQELLVLEPKAYWDIITALDLKKILQIGRSDNSLEITLKYKDINNQIECKYESRSNQGWRGQNADWDGDILCGGIPSTYAIAYIKSAWNALKEGRHFCLLVPLSFLDGVKKSKLIQKYPFDTLYLSPNKYSVQRPDRWLRVHSSLVWLVWTKGIENTMRFKYFPYTKPWNETWYSEIKIDK